MKKIKLLISDLDGTLLKQDNNDKIVPNLMSHSITSKNIEAVKKLQNNGICFAIATGRMSNQCYNLLSKINFVDKYLISQNGVYIENSDKEIISNNCFNNIQAQKLISKLHDFGFVPFFSTYDKIYLNKNKINSKSLDSVKHYLKTDSDKIEYEIIDFNNIDFNLLKIANFGLDASRITIEQMEDLELILNQEIDFAQILITSDNSIDIIPDKIDKKIAIEKLAQILNLDLDEIAFVGDSGNDKLALKLLKNSFCMDHARFNIKVNANHIVKSVAEAIDFIIEHNNKLK